MVMSIYTSAYCVQYLRILLLCCWFIYARHIVSLPPSLVTDADARLKGYLETAADCTYTIEHSPNALDDLRSVGGMKSPPVQVLKHALPCPIKQRTRQSTCRAFVETEL